MQTPWQEDWAVIAGGSRGLGFSLAKQLAQQAARVAIIGRDAVQLQRSAEELTELGSTEVRTFACDLARSLEDPESQSKSLQQFCQSSKIGLAISAIGQSDRGYLDGIGLHDLQSAMAINVFTALQFSRLLRRNLAASSGRLVHIASISGLAAAAGLGTYCISKAGLIAMSRQMRQEYCSDGISVTLICTGPIARVDANTRYESLKQTRNLPERLSAPGGGVKINSLDPDRLSQQILTAAAARTKEVVVPRKVRLLVAVSAFFPTLADRLIRKSFK